MAEKERKRIVIWSGGNDSTLVLWRELEKRNNVEAWSIQWDHISTRQQECERIAQEKFKKHVASYGKTIDHKFIKLEHDMTPKGNCPMQAALFFPLVTFLAPYDSTILWGIIHGDDFWQIRGMIEDAKYYQIKAMNKSVYYEFPLSHLKKYQVLQRVHNSCISPYVWTCEKPTEDLKPCGKCHSCIIEKLSKYEAKLVKESID